MRETIHFLIAQARAWNKQPTILHIPFTWYLAFWRDMPESRTDAPAPSELIYHGVLIRPMTEDLLLFQFK